ncbi:hypothetical protein [Synechococcus sp. CCAP 1479/9]|uniref:hypothetical protein n=1 Tax=Synechococcus sp. CCAP 1479/9 TaxID=1221593 RepID=UPI001C23F684|nr:hypothetical protein [Synechococcus sp. CCAP 1479/9]
MPALHYTHLRSLASDGHIRSLDMEASGTGDALVACGLEEADLPAPDGDRLLLELARGDHAGAFLSLRCRSSWPLEEAVRGMHNKYHRVYGLELAELAGYALDDVGRRYEYQENCRPEARHVPFPVEVVRSWDPSQAGLPHWARRHLEHRNDLKRYLKQHGILLIGSWALLADSSATRVREAMERTRRKTQLSVEQAVDLHGRYLPLYRVAKLAHRRATGRQQGWQPDALFLQQLDSVQPARQTRERLEFIAQALRDLHRDPWQGEEQRLLGEEGDDPFNSMASPAPTPLELAEEGPTGVELERRARWAVREAGAAYLKRMLEAIPAAEREQQMCFWCTWLQGASTRRIAECCQAPQARVSRRLQAERRAREIATDALGRLRRDPEFQEVFRSTGRLEAAAERLANHLLSSEQEGEEPPLRQMLRSVMENLMDPATADGTCAAGGRP